MHVRRLLDSGYWEQEDDFSFAIPILVGKGVFLISSVKSKYFLHKANSTPPNFMFSIVMGTLVEAYLKSVERPDNFSNAYSVYVYQPILLTSGSKRQPELQRAN